MDTGVANAGLPPPAMLARFDSIDRAMPALSAAAAAAIARARPTGLIRSSQGNHG